MSKREQKRSKELVDDIMKLSRGQASRRRIGSRAVPHRLRENERRDLERAMNQGYLSTKGLRPALLNTYSELCFALEKPAIIHEKTAEGDFLHINPCPGDTRNPAELFPQGTASSITNQGYRYGPLERDLVKSLIRDVTPT